MPDARAEYSGARLVRAEVLRPVTIIICSGARFEVGQFFARRRG